MGRSPLDWLLLPVRVLFQGGEGYPRFDGRLHPLAGILLPVALIAAWRQPLVRRALAVAGLWFVLWAASSQQMRFLIPALPLLAVATAVGGHALAARWLPGPPGRSPAALALIVAVLLVQASWTTWSRPRASMRRCGRAATSCALTPPTRSSPMLEQRLPADAKLLFVNVNRGFFCRREFIADSFFEASQTVADAARSGGARRPARRLAPPRRHAPPGRERVARSRLSEGVRRPGGKPGESNRLPVPRRQVQVDRARRVAKTPGMTSIAASPLALIPAAGFARRLGVAATKAALPVGSRASVVAGPPTSGQPSSGARAPGTSPEPLAACLVESLRRSGVADALVIRRAGGWDLAAMLGDGGERGVRVSYLVVAPTPSLPHTLARAASHAAQRRVALGFPDVLFEPADAFAPMLERQATTGAAVVLGLFPTERPSRSDMVVLDPRGRPADIVLTPPTTTLDYAWLLAVWTPEMTAFLERYVGSEPASAIARSRELRVGDVLRAALFAGLAMEAVTFPEGWFLDVATPEDLAAARARRTG